MTASKSQSYDAFASQCPSRDALALVADKWVILASAGLAHGQMRHGELMKRIDGISQRMLTRTLREMEAAGLVERRIFAEVPPRVEYTLTSLGASLSGPAAALVQWSEARAGEVLRE